MPARAGELARTMEVDVPFALFAAVESEAAAAGGLPPLGFGLVAGAVLLGLLGLTFAFRNVHNKH